MRPLLILIGILVFPVWGAASESAEVSPEERAAIKEVQIHLQQNRLEDAEQELEKQLAEFPKSSRIHALHMNFAYAYRRRDEHSTAFDHMEKLVDYYLSSTSEEPELYQQMANALDALSRYGQVADRQERVSENFEKILARLKQRGEESETLEPRLIGAVHDVRLRLIDFLIRQQEYEEADRYLMEELVEAKKEYEEKSDSPDFVLRLANALQSRVTLREVTGSEELEDARQRQLAFLELKAKKFSYNPEILTAYLDAHLTAINALSRSHPDRAGELLEKSRSFINGIQSEERVVEQKVMIAKRSLPFLHQLVIDGKRHAKLLETSWTPPEAISWLNTDPLKADDFAGKVVLLDFWSVWCVPCLDAFPDLTRWHKEYADDGLVVVGITRFYNYSWDEKRDQIVKEVERVVPEKEELEVLGRYARQQEIDYPLAITAPESEYQRNYHVVTLPQTVLVGRDGKIHLIRVGSGPTIAREIERKIEELLAAEPESSSNPKTEATTEKAANSEAASKSSSSKESPEKVSDETKE
ncbi:MAG: redoxin domain-containing protein [Planctomycetaceae bacterium]|nr:redoxin domain-containing protein [Planctomycetaceae bacterium]